MKYGTLPGIDRPVSRLILGSLAFSTGRQGLTNQILDRFVAAGGTAVDTARVYAGGTSEAAVGAWVRDRGCRDRMVIIGKGAHHDTTTNERRVTPAAIHEDVMATLRTMQLDRLDGYVLHRDDPDVPVGPIVEALNAEGAAGRIGAFGGSNWAHQRIAEANAYAEAHGLRPFAVSSPNLALAVLSEPLWPGGISLAGNPEATAWYAAARMPVLAWSSQARGFFSGKYVPGMTAETTEQRNVVRVYFSEANWERYRRADELARVRGCSRSQIALAWVLHQPLDVYPLVGPATVAELDDCLGALDIALSDDEVAWLNLQKEPVGAPG